MQRPRGNQFKAVIVGRPKCRAGLARLSGKGIAQAQEAAHLSSATLRHAVAAGFRAGARLSKHAAFAPLRDRSDFAGIPAEPSPSTDR